MQSGRNIAPYFPKWWSTSDSGGEINRIFSADSPDFTFCLESVLCDATKYGIASLVVSVLRLHFWKPSCTNSMQFCKDELEIIVNRMNFPAKTNESLHHLFKNFDGPIDLNPLIQLIKEDEYISKHDIMIIIVFLLQVVLQRGFYDSRSRVLLERVCSSLETDWNKFTEVEDSFADYLFDNESVYIESKISKLEREKLDRLEKIRRSALILTAGSVGGVIIGLTGGLAVPLVAAGAGALIGAGAATSIASITGTALITSIFGVTGAGLTGYRMKKRVGAIEEFSIDLLTYGKSLQCVLAVSGWISENRSEGVFHHHWRSLHLSREQYTLCYESKYLIELGKALEYFMSYAVSLAIQKSLMETALAGIVSAIAWPAALLSISNVLDNPWSVCISRAAKVGEFLAELLLQRAHGRRPISLIGFSLGARVIYHCLLAMSKRADSFGIIENVVLLGAPVSASSKQWSQICGIIGGKIISGYCTSDWVLRFLYRTMNVQFNIAGIGPVGEQHEPKIVNIDLSHIVSGHLDYSRKMNEILNLIGINRISREAEDSYLDQCH